MLILALDSAGSACNVCVWRDGTTLSSSSEVMQRGQDARLMPMVVEALAAAGVSFADLNRIAVTRGPGSFTGLRVGLAAARGIGLAADKPVIGIDRFALYRALSFKPGQALLTVIDSKRAELFCALTDAQGTPQEPRLMTQDQIDVFLAEHPDTHITGDRSTNDAAVAAACAALAAQANLNDPAFAPRPLYLREADVSFPKA